MATKVQMFKVRNEAGQYLGTYAATSAAQAIQKHNDSQATYRSFFRRRGSVPSS